jgi:hypothetical protein
MWTWGLLKFAIIAHGDCSEVSVAVCVWVTGGAPRHLPESFLLCWLSGTTVFCLSGCRKVAASVHCFRKWLIVGWVELWCLLQWESLHSSTEQYRLMLQSMKILYCRDLFWWQQHLRPCLVSPLYNAGLCSHLEFDVEWKDHRKLYLKFYIYIYFFLLCCGFAAIAWPDTSSIYLTIPMLLLLCLLGVCSFYYFIPCTQDQVN